MVGPSGNGTSDAILFVITGFGSTLSVAMAVPSPVPSCPPDVFPSTVISGGAVIIGSHASTG